MAPERADVVVIGAGIAGLVTTLELLDLGRNVLLLDRCHPHELGGLAREAFGGTFMVDTAEQRRSAHQGLVRAGVAGLAGDRRLRPGRRLAAALGRAVTPAGEPISGLYAVGEAAGFGGGGMHGKRSLEGTFLGGCVFSARLAAQSIGRF